MDGLIDDAVAKGAKLVAGGRRNGTVMTATVLDHVTPAMRIYAEECFGPVVAGHPRRRARTRRSASPTTPNTACPPRSSAATSRARWRSRARIESGICHINGPTVHDEAQMPFGGVKACGYGRFGGKAGIAEFTELRWITIETGPQHYPI